MSTAVTIVSQGAGSLVQPTVDAAKGIFASLKHKYDYIKNLDQNFSKLKMENNYLISRANDIKNKSLENQLVMEKTEECETWLTDVDDIKVKYEDVNTRYNGYNNGSGSGSSGIGSRHLRARLKLSREIVTLTMEIVALKDRMTLESGFMKRVRHPKRLARKIPTDVHEVPSVVENVAKLLEYLNDDKLRKIGVWGMPGVGKTTILEKLYDEVDKLRMFEIVIWVNLTYNVRSSQQIKQTILKQIGKNVEGIDNESETTSSIYEALRDRKYLLVLDEIGQTIELPDIGIYDSHSKGKIVLGTRDRSICHSMKTNEDIKVERLSTSDANTLFRNAAGDVVKHNMIEFVAGLVLKQCGNLPQLIQVVGKHLENKVNIHLWNQTLSTLQCPSKDQIKDMEGVFNALKLICENLEGSLKYCFLYGASFPEDHEIYQDYLIECWKTEQLIQNHETLREACAEGHSNWEKLIDKCLFDQCEDIKFVKVPILFRNVAVQIANQVNFGLLSRNNIRALSSYPPEEEWRHARVISLINSNLKELPNQPECNAISTLFLQKNDKLLTIPPLFFELMSTLKVLDLYGTGIASLPPSILKLSNLKGLYLNNCCELLRLPEDIRNLENLEVLDIRGTGIRGFPSVIGELLKLQCLRVSFTKIMDNPVGESSSNATYEEPANVFKTLLQLEELAIDADLDDMQWRNIAPVIAKQLAMLEKLCAFSFYFPTVSSLEAFLDASISWKNGPPGIGFLSFNIYVGSKGTINSTQIYDSKCSHRRHLHYVCGEDEPDAIKKLLSNSCAFELIDHKSIKSLSEFGMDKSGCVEVCKVEGCTTMESIIVNNNNAPSNSSSNDKLQVYPYLKELCLIRLPILKHIYQGYSVPLGSFEQLATLTLKDCPSLTSIISWEMVKHLMQLKYLSVEDCSSVTTLIEIIGNHSKDTKILPRLKNIHMVNLPLLPRIVSANSFEWHDLQNIDISGCDELINLSLDKHNAKDLRSIRCTRAWWERPKLSMDNETKAYLFKFCRFTQ